MQLISIGFVFFVVLLFVIYYILPLSKRWICLAAGSLAFYYFMDGLKLFSVFAVLVVINWICGIKIQEAGNDDKRGKRWLIIAVLIDGFSLFIYKYINFIPSTLNAISRHLGWSNEIFPLFSILAPIGISYFALTLIGYVVDVYTENCNAEKNLLQLFLFAGFFPVIISGPILRFEETRTTFMGNRWNGKEIKKSLWRIGWGVFKKLVVAERCGTIVNTIYGNYESYEGFVIGVAFILFAVQLYADFSGLMDIVLGVARLFGVVLPENFDRPFISVSISEFWRRWHITLGGWLRDFIMYPVLRSRLIGKIKEWCKQKWGKKYTKKFNLPVFIALIISWFLIGLWHGGGWNYIIGVGLWFGCLIILGEIFRPVFDKIIVWLHINTECYSWRLFQRIRTFIIFCSGLSLFRANSLLSGIEMWKRMFLSFNPWIFFDGTLLHLGSSLEDIIVLAGGFVVIKAVDYFRGEERVWDWLEKQNLFFRWLVLLVGCHIILYWGFLSMGKDASNFIYGRF